MASRSQPRFDRVFYRDVKDESKRAASEIVPFLYDLLRPRSVVDFGCGSGTWLKRFRDCGADEVLGLDGPWFPETKLDIPKEDFRAIELDRQIRLGRSFDVALCLEVAQYLPESGARRSVENLVNAAPIIVFSSAVPLQGATVPHKNEQWPAYWYEHFKALGCECHDVVRAHFWNSPEIPFFYLQNMLVYVRPSTTASIRRALANVSDRLPVPASGPLALVHPYRFTEVASLRGIGLKAWLRSGPGLVRRGIARRLSAGLNRCLFLADAMATGVFAAF